MRHLEPIFSVSSRGDWLLLFWHSEAAGAVVCASATNRAIRDSKPLCLTKTGR